MYSNFKQALILLLTSLCLAPAAAQPIVYPTESGIVDVTKPPYNADRSGLMDASAAINQALFDFNDSHALIYLPAGTYRLSNPVEWQNPPGCESGTTFTCRRYIGLTGAGVGQTILKLDDNHPDFQDPGASLALVNTGSSAAMAFENTIRNLTIDTGSGNPGATGLRFMASNVGGIHQVRVRSTDGQGFRGIDLGPNEQNGPAFYNDITVEGFDVGIRTFGNQNGVFMERVTLRRQNVYGFFNQQQVVSVRHLDYEGDVPAVFNQGDGGSTFVLVDSDIVGIGASAAEIGFRNNNRRPVFIRNVSFSGWALAYQEFQNGFDLGNLPNGNVVEYTSDEPVNLCDNVLKSLNLEVRETPSLPYEDTTDWVNIVDFGAAIDNGFSGQGSLQDDSDALQAALDAAALSGSETVVIPQPGAPFPARFIAFGDFIVPPTVRRIIGTKGNLSGDYRWIIDAGTDTLVLEDFVNIPAIVHSSARTLVIKHSVVRNYSSLPGGGSGDVYLEDVVGGPWEFNQQGVWARQFNLERDSFNVRINGGSLWALGVKTERKGTIIEATNGAKVEILGAFHYATISEEPLPKPMYIVNESSLSVAGLKELTYIADPYDVKLRETRNGVTNELLSPNEVLRTPLLVAYTIPDSANVAPGLDAGEEQILLLPQNTAVLDASINDDAIPMGNCFTASNWSLISGQTGVVINEPAARSTGVSFAEAGRYHFQLTVEDGEFIVRDTVTIHVFDTYSSTLDHDADGTASGNGADAYTQGWSSFRDNYGADGGISAKEFTSFPRKAIIRIDVNPLGQSLVENALLEFEISTTNSGLIENWTYNVFGLNDGDAGENWVEGTGTSSAPTAVGVTYETLPANVANNNYNGGVYNPAAPNSGGVLHDRTTFLGTFSTRKGVREKVNLASAALAAFINADSDGQVSFLMTRVDRAQNVISFASKENVDFQPPRLWFDLAAPLPLALLNFQATPNGKDVHLNWQADYVEAFSHFEVQRSPDLASWVTFHRVEANAPFWCADAGAMDREGQRVYYRLKMVDLDGSYSFSSIETIPLGRSAIRIAPNPFGHTVSIHTPQAQTMEVYDLTGRLMFTRHHRGAGTEDFTLDLKSGVYLLRFPRSGEVIRVIRR